MTIADPELRSLTAEDAGLLRKFTYLAIFVPEGETTPPREIVRTEPGLRHYWEGFGSEHDLGFVAEIDGRAMGAAWSRLIAGSDPGHGNVDEQTPELAIAVEPELRGRGIGTRLLAELLTALAGHGYAKVSLSVQKRNPALRLYRRAGFATVAENDNDYLMVRFLDKNAGASRTR